MFWLSFGIYTIFIVLIFAFFIVAKIHVYKFRDYSVWIEPVTKILAIVLAVLALWGYYVLWSSSGSESTSKTIGEETSTEIY